MWAFNSQKKKIIESTFVKLRFSIENYSFSFFNEWRWTDRDGNVLGWVAGVDLASELDDRPGTFVRGRLQELVVGSVQRASIDRIGRVDKAILQIAQSSGVVVTSHG